MDESTALQIIGTVKNVIFQNEENGYTVLRLDVGGAEPITVVGCLPYAAPGEGLSVDGIWERHPSHGEQFKAITARRSLPVGERHIYDYLASGAVKGIGPATASVIVTKFGSRALEILGEAPEKLAEIKGISPRKAREMSENFRRQNGLRLLMEFLASNGIRPEYAMRLYKFYGEGALELLKSNPYILSSDRIGGRFDEADALALSMGFEDDNPQRIAAALIFEMAYNLNNGHCFLPREKLIAATAQLIGVEPDLAEESLDLLIDEEEVIQEPVVNVTAVYLRRLYEAEVYTAARLRTMAQHIPDSKLNAQELAERMEYSMNIRYAPMQRQALELAANRQLLALTGGPGTGKTTTIRGILALFDELKLDCFLAAPTGRAAKRMTELTGREAYTIHRLLGAAWSAEGDELTFRKNESDPLRCDAIILDECSMVDIVLLQALLKAMPKNCRLVLVGDSDQLPSVGPGCVFWDILRSGAVATVRLTEVFRQSGESHIIRNAHIINRGEHPNLRENARDFFFLQRGTGDKTAATIVELCKDRLPRNMGFDPTEIQVLTPTRKGESGTRALNHRLQEALNPPSPKKKEKLFGETVFREGDRVMQIRNNYDILWTKGEEAGSGIFNGDVGRILSIDSENEILWIDFDEKLAAYGFEQLAELDHAFALTVHKSQGSEYRAVVLAAGRAPARLLSRDLLYTAVTRAREMLIMVGDTAVVDAMIDNGRKTKRYCGLRARLAGEL